MTVRQSKAHVIRVLKAQPVKVAWKVAKAALLAQMYGANIGEPYRPGDVVRYGGQQLVVVR